MTNPHWQAIDRWLVEHQPSELRRLAEESRLSEDEIEYGFAKAIERGCLDWIEEFATSLGCSLDRFSEIPRVFCPLTYAILNAGPSTVAKLLALGADPNVLVNQEHYHRPLHVAVDLEGTGHYFLPTGEIPAPFTELLVAYGADPLLPDANGRSAIDLAIRESHKIAERLLVKAAEASDLKVMGMLRFARRLTLTAGSTPELVTSERLQDLEFLRSLVPIALENSITDWVDDDLIRLGLWFLHLEALVDAESAARKASSSHPGRARLLKGIATQLAHADKDSHWRDLLALATD